MMVRRGFTAGKGRAGADFETVAKALSRVYVSITRIASSGDGATAEGKTTVTKAGSARMVLDSAFSKITGSRMEVSASMSIAVSV